MYVLVTLFHNYCVPILTILLSYTSPKMQWKLVNQSVNLVDLKADIQGKLVSLSDHNGVEAVFTRKSSINVPHAEPGPVGSEGNLEEIELLKETERLLIQQGKRLTCFALYHLFPRRHQMLDLHFPLSNHEQRSLASEELGSVQQPVLN